ncbi:AAA family ATPase [Streptomyces sp. SID11385]|uniref:AAA family ATPase n=1 Tax=Streptomyces sp. SID11385 TaxID=2706031 RepID=UPI0013CA81ED|nr:AAA family ATPase [Streptomyces sp. SID11385]NEA42732.1 AAA family ATPase [Streptomyces sp. SID11385]
MPIRPAAAPEWAAGALVVLVGPPAAGKSTWAAAYPETWTVCLDTYRALCADTEADQSATTDAVRLQDVILDARLARGLVTIVDSTATDAHVRRTLLARAHYWRRPASAILFTTSLNECLARNSARTRHVPESVIRRKHDQTPSAAELHDEGFDSVTTWCAP